MVRRGRGVALDCLDDEGVVELDQGRQGVLRELAEPVADGAGGREAGQAAEAGDEGITGDVAQMFQAASADVEQRQDAQREPAASVVSAGGRARGVQPARQVVLSQVAAEQFQTTVRRQLLVHELDPPLPLDHPSQTRYAQPHQRGLLCEGSNIGVFSLKTTQGAFLLQSHRTFTQHLFSDWG